MQVTVVHNLELFGIDAHLFARLVQRGVACSASVTPSADRSLGAELVVQGNQISFIAKLLIGRSTWLLLISYIKLLSLNYG